MLPQPTIRVSPSSSPNTLVGGIKSASLTFFCSILVINWWLSGSYETFLYHSSPLTPRCSWCARYRPRSHVPLIASIRLNHLDSFQTSYRWYQAHQPVETSSSEPFANNRRSTERPAPCDGRSSRLQAPRRNSRLASPRQRPAAETHHYARKAPEANRLLCSSAARWMISTLYIVDSGDGDHCQPNGFAFNAMPDHLVVIANAPAKAAPTAQVAVISSSA